MARRISCFLNHQTVYKLCEYIVNPWVTECCTKFKTKLTCVPETADKDLRLFGLISLTWSSKLVSIACIHCYCESGSTADTFLESQAPNWGGDEASLRATAHLLYYIREHDARMWGRCAGVIPLREKIRDLLTVKCWQDYQ